MQHSEHCQPASRLLMSVLDYVPLCPRAALHARLSTLFLSGWTRSQVSCLSNISRRRHWNAAWCREINRWGFCNSFVCVCRHGTRLHPSNLCRGGIYIWNAAVTRSACGIMSSLFSHAEWFGFPVLKSMWGCCLLWFICMQVFPVCGCLPIISVCGLLCDLLNKNFKKEAIVALKFQV